MRKRCWKMQEMSRYIDADEQREGFMEMVYEQLQDDPDNIRANLIIDYYDSMPTVDAVPVVRGRWILHPNGDGTCDQCGRYQKAIWDFDNQQNFCGHCGADMRERESNG